VLSALSTFLAGAWKYILGIGAAVVAALVALAQAKKAGVNEAVVKQKEKEVKDVGTAAKVERENAVAGADARRKRLRDRWTVG